MYRILQQPNPRSIIDVMTRRDLLAMACGATAGLLHSGAHNTRAGGPGVRTVTPVQSNYRLESDAVGHTLVAPGGQKLLGYLTSKPAGTNLLAKSACCFHPFTTPAGERITDFAPKDHPHHRGIFLAWHSMEFRQKADFSRFGPMGPTHGFDIHRGDFWGWGQFAPVEGRLITNKFVRLARADARSATLDIGNDWTIEGVKYLDEATTASVRTESGAHVLDLTYRLTPAYDLVLNQTAFGGFCARLRADGESFYADPSGKVTRPDPHYSSPDLNWPAAPWYAYTITLGSGRTAGCAVIDHPSNPPATWHNPRYVWMINPCIVAERAVNAPQARALVLRYRIVAYDGAPVPALLNDLSADWRRS